MKEVGFLMFLKRVDVDVRMSDGRLFHACGPATANARSPIVVIIIIIAHCLYTRICIVDKGQDL